MGSPIEHPCNRIFQGQRHGQLDSFVAGGIRGSAVLTQTKFQTSNRFLSLMLCSRKEKIIQNYFGRLVELLLGTGDYAYARWNTDDPHPKI